MAKRNQLQNTPKKILWIIGSILAVIVIGGTIWSANQAGFNLNSLRNNIGQVFGRLGGSSLTVSLNRTTLPANGTSSATIEAVLTNTSITPTASIIQGGGQISKTDSKDHITTFTYTADNQVGTTIILVKAGAIEEKVEIELVDSTPPAAPTLVSPADGSIITDPNPEVAGQGPANTKIVITDNGQSNTATATDSQGNFRARLTKPLYNGQHTLSAIAYNDLDLSSPVSNLTTVTVDTAPLTLDSQNLRIAPDRVLAGGSYGLFVPTSLNTNRVTLEINGQSFELFDYNESSIFTATLPAPDAPGVYIGDLILTDAANNSTRFDQAVRLSVTS